MNDKAFDWTMRYKPTPESAWKPEVKCSTGDIAKAKARKVFQRGKFGRPSYIFEILDPTGNV